MKKLGYALLMVLALAGTSIFSGVTPLLAHSEPHNHTKGPHGGQIGEADPFHVELVANKAQLEIYLYDGDMKPLRLDQFEVSAVLQSGSQRDKVDFVPAGGNQMNGASELAAKHGTKIIMVLKPKGKPQIQVSFGV